MKRTQGSDLKEPRSSTNQINANWTNHRNYMGLYFLIWKLMQWIRIYSPFQLKDSEMQMKIVERY